MSKLVEEDITYLRKMCRYIQSEDYKSAIIDEYMDEDELSLSKILSYYSFTNRLPIPLGFKNILEKIIDPDIHELIDIPINSLNIRITIDCINKKLLGELALYYFETSSEEISFDSHYDEIIGNTLAEDNEFTIPEEGIIELFYDGGGDSGYINSDFSDGQNVPESIRSWCYYVLEKNFGGWEIEAGSNGSFTIDFNNRNILLNHGWNVESVDYILLFDEHF
jgi:hypothetical protein